MRSSRLAATSPDHAPPKEVHELNVAGSSGRHRPVDGNHLAVVEAEVAVGEVAVDERASTALQLGDQRRRMSDQSQHG
jgi:hypothetical protein